MSESQPKAKRRGFLFGAAAVGAATAAVVALPTQTATTEAPVSEAPPKPERGGGYHVSDHVKQYYKTTLV